MPEVDLSAIWLTLKLATLTTAILLVIGTRLALESFHTRGWWRRPCQCCRGITFRIATNRTGILSADHDGTERTDRTISRMAGVAFLAIQFFRASSRSVIYSLPFVVQPLQNSFEAIGKQPLEAAATLRASPLDTFFSVILPWQNRDISRQLSWDSPILSGNSASY